MNQLKIPVFISKIEIEKIIDRLAKQIFQDLIKSGTKEVNFVTVLEGSIPFSRDLRAQLKKLVGKKFKINNYEIKISSYDGTQSGKLELKKDFNENIEEKDLIIIEDIVDTGKTMHYLNDYLFKKKKVKSVKICSFLSKPSRREKEIFIDYLGKEIPDKFVIGYGLDKDGEFRDLDYVGIWKE